ncbi:hypothetical protein D3C86_1705570 [compost metagenome]
MASLLAVPKYNHHIARVPSKVTNNPTNTGISQCPVSASTAPLASSVSPRATITNSWQRSARCAPSMVQSLVRERPSPGSAKPNMGDTYSHSTAISHRPIRHDPSINAPANQNAAAITTQPSMRLKFGASACSPGKCSTIKAVRPT